MRNSRSVADGSCFAPCNWLSESQPGESTTVSIPTVEVKVSQSSLISPKCSVNKPPSHPSGRLLDLPGSVHDWFAPPSTHPHVIGRFSAARRS